MCIFSQSIHTYFSWFSLVACLCFPLVLWKYLQQLFLKSLSSKDSFCQFNLNQPCIPVYLYFFFFFKTKLLKFLMWYIQKLDYFPSPVYCVLFAVETTVCAKLFHPTLWTAACQVPMSKGIFRWEYFRTFSFPSPGDLPNPGTEPGSLTSTCTGSQVLYQQRHLESPKLY